MKKFSNKFGKKKINFRDSAPVNSNKVMPISLNKKRKMAAFLANLFFQVIQTIPSIAK